MTEKFSPLRSDSLYIFDKCTKEKKAKKKTSYKFFVIFLLLFISLLLCLLEFISFQYIATIYHQMIMFMLVILLRVDTFQ